tara:strand:+ start:52 stop:510 length:459 start_codon:yes stop_codon:yes gene_type:complete
MRFYQSPVFLGNHRNLNMVLKSLKKFKVPKTIKSEKDIEGKLHKHLYEEFSEYHSVATQYNIGGYLGFTSDIDIADGHIGIEIKLTRELTKKKSQNIQRLFGQIIYQVKRKYNGNNRLIVLIVGPVEKKESSILQEIIKFTKDLDATPLHIK